MPTTISRKVTSDLYLVGHDLGQETATPPVAVEIPTNHFAVIDCSGSMSYDLPKIREQLKKKLPKVLKEKDTITIIWFSGRSQFGTLLEAEPVATLADLNEVNKAIDRWLKPVGLTGFKEPLEEAATVVQRVNKKNPGSVSSLFFMSDGCDNQWGRPDILKAVENAAGGFASATFVEYGYYADRPLLTSMAEKAGGSLIFAEDFDKYAPTFESALQKKQSGAPRIEVTVPGDPIGGFVFSQSDGDLITYAVEGGKTRIPKDLQAFWFLSPTALGDKTTPKTTLTDLFGISGEIRDLDVFAQTFAQNILPFTTDVAANMGATISAAYAAVSLFAVRMKPNIVYPLLKAMGDVRLIEQFSNCFGKQKYSEFQETAQKASFGEGCFLQGWDPNRVPRDDAFTVLDVLALLASDDNNRVLLEHSSFKYSRIGRGRVDASDQLTDAEQKELQELTAKLVAEKSAAKINDINAKIAALTANKPAALRFEDEPAPDGYPISSLTFNEDRPNVSFLVRKPGTVDLTSRLNIEFGKAFPTRFPTHIFRNYAVVKDGLVNIDKLPVRVTAETFKKLQNEGVHFSGTTTGDHDIVIDLKALPVVNRKMINSVSAKTFFETQYALTIAQAEQKVYNAYAKDLLASKRSEGIAEKYGADAAAWLQEQGITDGGFNPKSTQAEATDFYMGKELKVSLKGLSKLPSLKEAKEQIAKGKINAGGALMQPTVELVESFLASPAYQQAAQKDKVLEAWLEGQQKAAKAKTRDLIFQIAQTTFSLVVGQVWFNEFSSLDENSMSITVGKATLECKAEMREIQIRV